MFRSVIGFSKPQNSDPSEGFFRKGVHEEIFYRIIFGIFLSIYKNKTLEAFQVTIHFSLISLFKFLLS